MSFPPGSDGKESACNAGDPGSIPGQEDSLKQQMVTHSIFLPRKSHGQRSLVGYTVHGVTKSQTKLND